MKSPLTPPECENVFVGKLGNTDLFIANRYEITQLFSDFLGHFCYIVFFI